VGHEVTNACNDMNQLNSMALRAKAMLEVDSLEVVADAGCYNSQEIKDCTDQDIVPYIPQTNSLTNKKAGLHTKEDFRYDGENDCYWCPAGEALRHSSNGTYKRG